MEKKISYNELTTFDAWDVDTISVALRILAKNTGAGRVNDLADQWDRIARFDKNAIRFDHSQD